MQYYSGLTTEEAGELEEAEEEEGEVTEADVRLDKRGANMSVGGQSAMREDGKTGGGQRLTAEKADSSTLVMDANNEMIAQLCIHRSFKVYVSSPCFPGYLGQFVAKTVRSFLAERYYTTFGLWHEPSEA